MLPICSIAQPQTDTIAKSSKRNISEAGIEQVISEVVIVFLWAYTTAPPSVCVTHVENGIQMVQTFYYTTELY